MLTNKETGNKVYIDIDIVFEDFITSLTWESIKMRLPGVEEFIEREVSGLRVRPSSSGNAHIEISFNHNINVLDNLCVRAWLNDDLHRLRLDLVRYLKTDNPSRINRLWSGKWKRVNTELEMKLCQNWQVVDLKFMHAAREQWFKDQALKAQEELNNEERKKEIERASEGMVSAMTNNPVTMSDGRTMVLSDNPNDIIPEGTPTYKNYDWPEMYEELTPAPVAIWKAPQPQQTSQHPPEKSPAVPDGQSTLLQ